MELGSPVSEGDRSGRAGGCDDPLDGEAGAEALLPSMREELGDSILRVVVNADEDVGEIDLGIDVVSLAGSDERIEDHETPACLVVAEEERILPRQSDDSQRRFGGVVVNRESVGRSRNAISRGHWLFM